MEGRIERGNHRQRRAQYRARCSDTAHARRIMQRGDLTKSFGGLDHAIIDPDRSRELITAMNHSVSHGIKGAKRGLQAQPLDNSNHRLLVVSNRRWFLLRGTAKSLK